MLIFATMSGEKNKGSKFLERIQKHSRFVILNNETFEEERSFTLSPLNIIIYVLFGIIVSFGLAFLLFSYTPLNALIARDSGKTGTSKMERINKENLIKIEELENKAAIDGQYLNNIKALLNGDDVDWETDQASLIDSTVDYNSIDITSSKEDSILRANIESQEKYRVGDDNQDEHSKSDNMKGVFFFPPLKGELTNSFGGDDNHIGVDIIAPENEAVKSTLNGTIIFTGWTSDNGHVIHVQHSNNIVSVYKHNSVILKEVGERVKAGDPIAIVGNTGSLSNGAHLHFELWYNGTALDPQKFIAF